MNLTGSAISFPFRAEKSGTITTTADKSQLIVEAIIDVLETRKGERVMMPDYGINDFVFATVNVGFEIRLKHEFKTQIERYVPEVERVQVSVDYDDNGRVIANISYYERDAVQFPKTLVFPVWQYVGG